MLIVPTTRNFKARILMAAAAMLSFSAAAETIKNSDCFDCHSDRELTKTNTAGQAVSLFTDEAVFKASVHGNLDCIDCHADIKELPHEDRLARVDCASCHEEEVAAYRDSLHGRAWTNGVTEAASCADCHGKPHAMLASDDPASTTHFTKIPETCAQCHAKPEIVAEHLPGRQSATVTYEHGVHGLALRKTGKHAAVCTDCHGDHDIRAGTDPKSTLFWQNIPGTCGTCHEEIHETFMRSVHGKAAANGLRDAPVCTDCHGEHSIAAVAEAESTVSPAHIPETCGQCHGAERLATRYTLPTDVVDTYMQSFHGLAAQIGGVSAANCASCHGVHDILPSSDPASSISPANLPTTCGKCHQGIGTRLASGTLRIHQPRGAAPGKPAIVSIISNAYVLLIVMVIGGMFVYVLLDYAAHFRAHVRGVKASPDAEVRMTPLLQIQHGLLVVLFVVLAYTGFVHTYPDAFWSWPFRAMSNGSYVRGLIHRIAGWAFTLLFLVHLIALVATSRGHGYLLELRLRWHDATDALLGFRRNVGLTKKTLPHRRFNFAEKAEYWALVWGSVVMIVTGVMLIYTNAVLRLWPEVFHQVAQVVHFYEAVLATLAIVVWHFYWVIFDPKEYPMNPAWMIGKKPGHAQGHGAEPADEDDEAAPQAPS